MGRNRASSEICSAVRDELEEGTLLVVWNEDKSKTTSSPRGDRDDRLVFSYAPPYSAGLDSV